MEPKLNFLPDPKLRIVAPAPALAQTPFYVSQTLRNVVEKIMVATDVFENCFNAGDGSAIRICSSVEPEPKEIVLLHNTAYKHIDPNALMFTVQDFRCTYWTNLFCNFGKKIC